MLIVDDNEEMLNFLSGNFSNQYSILTAEDGIEALEKLKENDVTLIVSDWMMPRMDGGGTLQGFALIRTSVIYRLFC